MAENAAAPAVQHLISLRVMRMSRPRFDETSAADRLVADPADELSVAIAGGGEWRAAHTAELLAPNNLETVYLGETFTFYVQVVNESEQTVTDVCVKTDMQTNTQRVSLACTLENLTLREEESEGEMLTHEVKEVGQHILVASANYRNPVGEQMILRKFFKFPVVKPIDVKTKFYNAESNDVFLEALIENTSSQPMVMETVELDPAEHYIVQALQPIYDKSASREYESRYLRPKEARQFLFRLSPKDSPARGYRFDLPSSAKMCFSDVTNIGKLDMTWRTVMGERGRLQTSALQRIAPGTGDIRLTVEKFPASVRLRQIFQVSCRLHNCCDRSLDLRLRFANGQEEEDEDKDRRGAVSPTQRRPSALVFCSTSGVFLGQLPPGAATDFNVELLPVTSGLHTISGIRVVDAFLKRTYEYDDVAQVFVV